MTPPALQETPSVKQPPLFELGQIVATPGVLLACSEEYLSLCLGRHIRGDWGNVWNEDQETNDAALIEGDRILSAYPGYDNDSFIFGP